MQEENPNQKPSIIKIIVTDYIAFLGLLGPLVFWVMYLILFTIGFLPNPRGNIISQESLPFFFNLSLVATVLGIPITLLRLYKIGRYFKSGIKITGSISDIWFYRDRGRVTYTYDYQGESYKSGNAVHKIKQTKLIRVGEAKELLIDPTNPKKAIIQDLYSA